VVNGFVSVTNNSGSSNSGAQCEYQVDGAAFGNGSTIVPAGLGPPPGQLALVGRVSVSPGTHTVQVACLGTRTSVGTTFGAYTIIATG
jgi:hypothetical protein